MIKDIIWEIVQDALIDSIKLIPFLFLTYLAIEYLEHKAGNHASRLIEKAGVFGPFLGGILGAVPQCGFSAAASNLYAGRIISLGTLIAIYLSTSDEMLPILISEKADVGMIVKIVGIKVIIGMMAGFLIDLFYRRHKTNFNFLQEKNSKKEREKTQSCHCRDGIFYSALKHTITIFFFILIITLGLNIILHFVGEEALTGLLLNQPIIGQVLAGIVGLIPNCASSIIITQLYLEGAMSLGAMMSGLLVGAGIGILVLCRVNHNKKENMKIISFLYLIGVFAGIMIELLQIKI